MRDFEDYVISDKPEPNKALQFVDAVGDFCFQWANATLYTGLERPISGVKQLTNQIAGRQVLSENIAINEPLEAAAGSKEWIAQQMGAGTGYALDLFLLRKLVRTAPARSIGAFTEKTLSHGSVRWMNSEPARMFAAGFAMEGITAPVHEDEMDRFWTAKLRMATNGGIAFSSIAASNSALDRLSYRSTAFRRFDDGMANIPRLLASGMTAGFLTAEAHTLMSEHRVANFSELGRSMGSYGLGCMTTGFGVGRAIPLTMPPLEKTGFNPSKERQTLIQLLKDNHVAEQALPLMDGLENRAFDRDLSHQEIARTYHLVSRLFREKADAPVTPAGRKQVALESLHHAAYPTSIDQGANPTCVVTASESSIFATNPAGAVRVISNVALKGTMRTNSGDWLKLQERDLQPDSEAAAMKLQDIGGGSRTYASQLYQLAAINAYWQNRAWLSLPQGQTIQYRERMNATDEQTSESIPADSKAGRLVVIDQDNIERSKQDDSPSMNNATTVRSEQLLTGKIQSGRILASGPTELRQFSTTLQFQTLGALRNQLQRLHDSNGFPVLIDANTRAGRFWTDRNGDGPIIISKEDLGITNHSIQITGYSPGKGTVTADNTWGNDNDMTGQTNKRKELTLNELAEIMQSRPTKAKMLWLSGNQKLTDKHLTAASELPELNEVQISDTAISDAGLHEFAGHKQLEKLHARNTKISDDSSDTLAMMTNLTRLDLSENNIGDKSATAIGKLSQLESLALNKTKISDAGVKELGTLSSLTSLELFNCDITDASLDALANLTKLTELQLGGSDISCEKVIELVKQLPELKSLQLDISSLEPGLYTQLRDALPNRCTLSLADTKDNSLILLSRDDKSGNAADIFSPSSETINAAFLDRFTDLSKINVNGAELSAEAAKRLGKMSKLQNLSLRSVEVSDEACSNGLLSAPALKSLYLGRVELKTALLKAAAASSIRQLSIGSSHLESDSLSVFADNKNIDYVALGNCGTIHTNIVSDLKKLPALSNLSFSRSTLDEQGVDQVLQMQNLQTLDLGDTEITTKTVDGLLTMPVLQALAIGNTKVTEENVRRLAALPTLRALILPPTMKPELIAELKTALPKCRIEVTSTPVSFVALQQQGP